MTKIKNILAAFATIVIFSNITNAQTVNASYTYPNEPLAVKYVGVVDNYLTFKVSVDEQVSDNSFFAITDKSEGVLYSSNLRAKYNERIVKVEKKDDQILDFKLVVGKKTYLKSFSINTMKTETTTVAENDITKF